MLKAEQHGPVIKFRLARGILSRAAYYTAAYWVDGLLVDSGCAFAAQELLRALNALPVQQIVNTHSHEDHIGGNGLLQRDRAVSILAHPLALPILADPKLQHLQPYRRLFWGWPAPSKGESVPDWVETAHHRFQVIGTPGHSPDHICLYEPEQGWLFSGDAYIGGRERAARPDYDIYKIIASLKELAALRLTKLFSGSGTVRDSPAEDIQQKVVYLEGLAAEVRRLHNQGMNVHAIRRRVLGRDPSITYLTHGHFRGRYLIEAFLRDG